MGQCGQYGEETEPAASCEWTRNRRICLLAGHSSDMLQPARGLSWRYFLRKVERTRTTATLSGLLALLALVVIFSASGADRNPDRYQSQQGALHSMPGGHAVYERYMRKTPPSRLSIPAEPVKPATSSLPAADLSAAQQTLLCHAYHTARRSHPAVPVQWRSDAGHQHRQDVGVSHAVTATDIRVVIPVQHRLEHYSTLFSQWERAIKRTSLSVGIIIVEAGTEPTSALSTYLPSRFPFLEYVFFENSWPSGFFPKSLLMNLAFLHRNTSKYYLFHDFELLVPEDFLLRIESTLKQQPDLMWAQPYRGKQVCYLDEGTTQSTVLWLKTHSYIHPSAAVLCKNRAGSTGGSILVSKQAFESVGGFDSDLFWGYGPEDLFFWSKLSTLAPPFFMEDLQLYHLHHPSLLSTNLLYIENQVRLLETFQSLDEVRKLVFLRTRQSFLLGRGMDFPALAWTCHNIVALPDSYRAISPFVKPGLEHCTSSSSPALLAEACKTSTALQSTCVTCGDRQWDGRTKYGRAKCSAVPTTVSGHSGQRPVVVAVSSRAENAEKRAAIRKTWGQLASDTASAIVFVIEAEDPSDSPGLLKEILTFNDLFVCKIRDSEQKSSGGFFLSFVDWLVDGANSIAEPRHKFQYLMKTDDTSFVRVDKVEQMLLHREMKSLFWGYPDGPFFPNVRRQSATGPHRDFVPEALPPGVLLADCGNFVLSRDLVLFLASRAARNVLYDGYPSGERALNLMIMDAGVILTPAVDHIICRDDHGLDPNVFWIRAGVTDLSRLYSMYSLI